MHEEMSVRAKGYVDRVDFIVELCRGRKVVDLGVIGETCRDFESRIVAFPSSLHARLADVASYLVGVDKSTEELGALRATHPKLVLYAADIEEPGAALDGEGLFEVAVAGDVIEHLSNPGRALDWIRRVLEPQGSLVVTCPNAFGAPNYIRFLSGRFREGADHVQSYNKHTLANLVRRHGFSPISVWTALDRAPRSPRRRAAYRLAAPILKLFPELGGTLVLLARREDSWRAHDGPSS